MKTRKVSAPGGIEVIDTQIPQRFIRSEWLMMHTRQLDNLINTITDPTHDNMATGRVYHVSLIIFATMVDFERRDILINDLETRIAEAIDPKNGGLDYVEQMRVKSEIALKMLPQFTDYIDTALAVSHAIGLGSTGEMPDADKMDYSEFTKHDNEATEMEDADHV